MSPQKVLPWSTLDKILQSVVKSKKGMYTHTIQAELAAKKKITSTTARRRISNEARGIDAIIIRKPSTPGFLTDFLFLT